MFSYCGNNPVSYCDPSGNTYRTVGAGFQFEINMGCGTVGIEVIVYWDVQECNSGENFTVAVYAYGGVSIDCADPLLGSILATITDNSDIFVSGSEAEIIAMATLLSEGFSMSVSGVLICGDESFNSTESYQESFTSVGASIGRIKGSLAYSNNCRAYSLGANIVGAKPIPCWGISKSYYYQIFEFTV